MKQRIINITDDILIIKCTDDDGSEKTKVVTDIKDNDSEFIAKIEALIQEHYGN